MRQKNESLSDYLQRIHKEEIGYYYGSGEEEQNVLIKKYKKFIKDLNYHDDLTDEEEKVFRFFIRTGETLKSFFKKGVGENHALKKLKNLYIGSVMYYEAILYPHYYTEALQLRPKDAQIHIMDSKRLNLVPDELEPESFIKRLDALWGDFLYYYSQVLSAPIADGHSISQAVDDEIVYYNTLFNNYNQPNDEPEGQNIEYYNGQNDNPYKNLYIYCLFRYVSYYLDTKFPAFPIEKFIGVKELKAYKSKISLSLMDIAEAYALIDKTTPDKAYNRIKKQFQKDKLFQSSKNEKGEYVFDNVIEPIAFYEAYRKKNFKVSEDNDRIIRFVYCKLIEFVIDDKFDNIEAIERYQSFFKEAYSKLAKIENISDDKFSTFLEILFLTANRISLRLVAPKQVVDEIGV